MTARIVWDATGQATLVSFDAQGTSNVVRLVSTTAAPPGARVTGTLTGDAGTTHAVRMKIHSSRRRPDGAFDIEGRLLDLRNETKELLLGLMYDRSSCR